MLLITEAHQAQTVIREKVFLTPQSKFKNVQQADHPTWWPCTPPSKTYDYYNHRQAVWMYSTFPLNPGRQPLQSNVATYDIDTSKFYTFKIISGGNYFHFVRNYYNGNDWITEKITDTVRVKGKDLWPKAYKNGTFVTIYDSVRYIDRDGAPFYSSYYYYEYSINFDGIWNREEEVVYSVTDPTHTYYVHTFIKRPTYTLSTNNVRDTLLYGLKRVIPIQLEINECKSELSMFIFRNGGLLNREVEFSMKIVEGASFGNLLIEDYYSGDQLQFDYNTIFTNGGPKLITKGNENPDSVVVVRVEITSNDPDVTPRTIYSGFYVKHNPNPPPGLEIIFEKNYLAPGDSTEIYLRERKITGELVDFPAFKRFNIRIEEGTEHGRLYSSESSYYSDQFWDVSKDGLKFYSFEDMIENMASVTIYVEEAGGIIAGNILPGKNNSNNQLKRGKQLNTVQNALQQNEVLSATGTIYIVQPLLLGETRYYGLQWKDIGGKKEYRIKDIPAEYGTKPSFPAEGWTWIKTSSVWSDNPISVVTEGGKSGIYWEKKYYDKNSNSNPTLEDGMIRVVGRYWEEGREDNYKVKLKAQDGSRTIEVEIKVVKPGKLGFQYDVNNVFGDPIVLDDTISTYAGKYGIPPQLIKAHMRKEGYDPNYGNIVPAYRYEPFIDKKIQKSKEHKKKYLNSSYPYVVNKVNMGSGETIPESHNNAIPPYPTTPVKIGTYLTDNFLRYLNRKEKKVLYDSSLTELLTEKFNTFSNDTSFKELSSKKILYMAIDTVKKYILFGNAGKGYDFIAQTRIVASYGFLNLTFYSTTDGNKNKGFGGFTKTNTELPPEYLNDRKYFFPAYKEELYYYMKLKVQADIKDSEWPEGYDTVWKKTIQWHNFKEKGYSNDVFGFIKNFLPAK